MRLIALALCMLACNVGLVIQDDRNAPPPVDIRSPAPERPPPDPDLHFAYRSMRALLGGGFTAGGVRGAGGSYLGAMEGHLIYGRDAGIPDALGLRYPPGFPVVAVPDDWVAKRGIGLDLGWVPILDDDRPSRIPGAASCCAVQWTARCSTNPTRPAERMRSGSGTFFVFVSTISATRAMTTVGRSTMARRPRT